MVVVVMVVIVAGIIDKIYGDKEFIKMILISGTIVGKLRWRVPF